MPPARDKTCQELERLTLHSLSKIFDLFKKELLGVCSSRSFGKGNIDLGSDCLQFLLSTLKLVAQGADQGKFIGRGCSPLNGGRELPTVSYETDQALEPADEPCTGGPQSQTVIGKQDASKHKIH
jgi:hypothetical protein